MTNRQAMNTLIWFVLLPITIAVWAQVLFGYPNFRTTPEPIRIQSVQAAPVRYTVCGIAGPWNCWEVGGTPRR